MVLLLHLELDGALDFVHFALEVLVVVDKHGVLAGLLQARTNELGDLLEEGRRGQEGVVLLGELLDQLLVLVKLLKSLHIHAGQIDGVGLLNVGGITKNAQLHVGLRDVGQARKGTG